MQPTAKGVTAGCGWKLGKLHLGGLWERLDKPLLPAMSGLGAPALAQSDGLEELGCSLQPTRPSSSSCLQLAEWPVSCFSKMRSIQLTAEASGTSDGWVSCSLSPTGGSPTLAVNDWLQLASDFPQDFPTAAALKGTAPTTPPRGFGGNPAGEAHRTALAYP